MSSELSENEENSQPLLNGEKKERVSNQRILQVCALLFGLFVIAEMIGAVASNSLSLLGDAAAMSVDTFSYLCNMYAERVKSQTGVLDSGTRRILEVYIPTFSVCALLGVTCYIVSDAIAVIRGDGGEEEEVNVIFLWTFSIISVFVDLFSSLMFYWGGKDALTTEHHAPLRTFSLDRRSFDMGKRQLIPTTILNLNMISALTHVGGDSLRTLAVFTAALIATVTKYDGSICDAWASIVVSASIFLFVIPLCNEIYKAAFVRENEDLILRPQDSKA